MTTFKNELFAARPKTHESPMKISNVMGRGAANVAELMTTASINPNEMAAATRRGRNDDMNRIPRRPVLTNHTPTDWPRRPPVYRAAEGFGSVLPVFAVIDGS